MQFSRIFLHMGERLGREQFNEKAKEETARAAAILKAERLAQCKAMVSADLAAALKAKEQYDAARAEWADKSEARLLERKQEMTNRVRRAAQWFTVTNVTDEASYVDSARAALNNIKVRAKTDRSAVTGEDADSIKVRVIFIHDHRTRSSPCTDIAGKVGAFLRECQKPEDIALFLNTNVPVDQGRKAEPLARTKKEIRELIVGATCDVFHEDEFVVSRVRTGALNERPRMEWVALRTVAKQLRTRTPKDVEHYVWTVHNEASAWDSAASLAVGEISDVPWPSTVFNVSKYGSCESSERASTDDYVRIGKIFPKDRSCFRGVECCRLMLQDFMAAVRTEEPETIFIVFDTCGSVGEWLAAAVQCSVRTSADGPILQPATFGCFGAAIEPNERQYGILTARRNVTLEEIVASGGTLADGAHPLPSAQLADAAEVKSILERCNRQCTFLQVDASFTRLARPLMELAAELDVDVDSELSTAFGVVREHFEDPCAQNPQVRTLFATINHV